MNDQRSLLVLAAGACSLALGVVGLAADLPVFGVIAGAMGAALAILGIRFATDRSTQHERASTLAGQVGELESALATQVQARLAAEDSVRSLGTQLVDAQQSAVSLLRSSTDANAQSTMYSEMKLARFLLDAGRFSEAEQLLLTADSSAAGPGALQGHGHPAAAELVTLYERWGRPDSAAVWRTRLGSNSE